MAAGEISSLVAALLAVVVLCGGSGSVAAQQLGGALFPALDTSGNRTVAASSDDLACLRCGGAQAIDDGDPLTVWQSVAGDEAVNITLDLRIEQEVFRVDVQLAASAPAAAVLERSLDGRAWTPYQFFAHDCPLSFGLPNDGSPQSTEEAVCTTAFSDVRSPDLSFRTLAPQRPPQGLARDYARSDALQAFTRARYLRLRFVRRHTPESARDFLGNVRAVDPHYAVSSFDVTSRCACNGHADRCEAVPGSGDGLLSCACQHNTTGQTCAECRPLFNAKPWLRAIDAATPNHCVDCGCTAPHGLACVYEAALDAFPTARDMGGGGVCNCSSDTAGRLCDTCRPAFWRTPGVPITAGSPCSACGCSTAGATSDVCDVATGQCTCKANTRGAQCDSCRPGTYGLAAATPEGCTDCGCLTSFTVNASGVCDATTGQCPCNSRHVGRTCDTCARDYYRSSSTGLCEPCDANCLGCTGPLPTQCKQCRVFEDDGVCVPACPLTKYASPGRVCQDCSNQCLGGCSGPDPTVSDCNACVAVARNGTCTDSCGANEFVDRADVCQACDPQCSADGCTGPGPLACRTCASVLVPGTGCLAQCPSAMYPDAANVCMPCDPACRACSGPTPAECSLCAGVRSSLGVCTDACLAFEFVADGACTRCSPQCLTACQGPSGSDCVGLCSNVVHNGSCVQSCPAATYPREGYFCDPCADTCSQSSGCLGPGRDQCTACAAHAFRLDSGNRTTCLDACPNGMFADAARVCQPCDAECLLCSGPGPSQCSRCRSHADGLVCVAACPVGKHAVASARRQNASRLDAPLQCVACDEQCDVLGCSGPGPTRCARCAGFADVGPTCVAACPLDKFADSGRTCRACHAQCADGCTGPLSTDCVSCAVLLHPDLGCVAQCPPGTVGVDGACRACHPECSEVQPGCSGTTATDCLACRTAVFQGACVAACPTSAYLDRAAAVCRPCHAECNGCRGPGPSRCSACFGVLSEGACTSECEARWYADGDSVCQPCHPECASACTGPAASQCGRADPSQPLCRTLSDLGACVDTCPEDRFFVDGGVCVASCPDPRPFYNDTRGSPTPVPAQCLVDCSQLDDPAKVFASDDAPLRCSTQEQLSTTKTAGLSGGFIIVLAVAIFVCLLALMVVVVAYRRRRQRGAVGTYDFPPEPVEPAPPTPPAASPAPVDFSLASPDSLETSHV